MYVWSITLIFRLASTLMFLILNEKYFGNACVSGTVI